MAILPPSCSAYMQLSKSTDRLIGCIAVMFAFRSLRRGVDRSKGKLRTNHTIAAFSIYNAHLCVHKRNQRVDAFLAFCIKKLRTNNGSILRYRFHLRSSSRSLHPYLELHKPYGVILCLLRNKETHESYILPIDITHSLVLLISTLVNAVCPCDAIRTCLYLINIIRIPILPYKANSLDGIILLQIILYPFVRRTVITPFCGNIIITCLFW